MNSALNADLGSRGAPLGKSQPLRLHLFLQKVKALGTTADEDKTLQLPDSAFPAFRISTEGLWEKALRLPQVTETRAKDAAAGHEQGLQTPPDGQRPQARLARLHPGRTVVSARQRPPRGPPLLPRSPGRQDGAGDALAGAPSPRAPAAR